LCPLKKVAFFEDVLANLPVMLYSGDRELDVNERMLI
jgi:hypothetical protein